MPLAIAAVCFALAFHAAPTPSLPVSDLLVDKVYEDSKGQYWIKGSFDVVVDGPVQGTWPLPDKPEIYISQSTSFDPSANWTWLGEATSWKPAGKDRAEIDFNLPIDVGQQTGFIVVTLNGVAHYVTSDGSPANNQEISIAGMPYPPVPRGTVGGLANSIVPIGEVPNYAGAEIGGQKIHRQQVFLNAPWSRWTPNNIPSRPIVYVQFAPPPALSTGAPPPVFGGSWVLESLSDPNEGVSFDEGKQEVQIHYTISGTPVLIYCYDLSSIHGIKWEQISGVIRDRDQ